MPNAYESGEIFEIMSQFEKNPMKLYGMRYEREQREIGGQWTHGYYCHGETNNAFLAYLSGYALGKAIQRLANA